LAERALAHAPWPAVRIETSPPSNRLAVNFPVWLHVESGWQSVRASASLAGVTATVTARPARVRFEMGDGHAVTCQGAGSAYDPDLSWQQNLDRRSCGYTYRTSSAGSPSGRFTVRASITYAVSWSASGAPGGGSLGGYTWRTSLPVTVGQIETLED
jgi:hypothetical protein